MNTEHTLDQLRCVRSPIVERRDGGIEGIGLFATTDIEPNEIIAFKGGRLFDGSVFEEHRKVIGGSHMQVASELFIGGLTPEEVDATLIGFNHSCQPNAYVWGHIGVRTLHGITAGQEITVDYRTCYRDKIGSQRFGCICRQPGCSGFIDSTDDALTPTLRQRYRGKLVDFLANPESYEGVSLRPVDPDCPVSSFIAEGVERINGELVATDLIKRRKLIAIFGGYIIDIAKAEVEIKNGLQLHSTLYLAGVTERERAAVSLDFAPSSNPNVIRRHIGYFALEDIRPGDRLTARLFLRDAACPKLGRPT